MGQGITPPDSISRWFQLEPQCVLASKSSNLKIYGPKSIQANKHCACCSVNELTPCRIMTNPNQQLLHFFRNPSFKTTPLCSLTASALDPLLPACLHVLSISAVSQAAWETWGTLTYPIQTPNPTKNGAFGGGTALA